MLSSNLSSGMDFYRTLLEKAIENGEVRADIDVKMVAYYITMINNGMVEYYSDYVDHHYDEAMLATIDQFIDFLQYGLASRSSPNDEGIFMDKIIKTKGEQV